MLEKPDIQDHAVTACLRDAFDLTIQAITFLPIGADQNTAVYRAVAADGSAYFVKLRGGIFDPTSVTLPRFLYDQGLQTIIRPLATRSGALWTHLDRFRVTLFPYVEGRNARQVPLSERHWAEFGSTMRSVHGALLPSALAEQVRPEIWAPEWRESLRTSLSYAKGGQFDDPVAAELAAFLHAKRDDILALVDRAEQLAGIMQTRSLEFVLCHSDIHASNILISVDDSLYVVDWDDPILAPKERDLMFPGGAQGFIGHTACEEERLFFQGYGQTEIDHAALAYYRFERIVQDIAIYCEQLLLSTEGGRDREQSLQNLKSNFRPNSTIAMAYRGENCIEDAR